VNRWQALQVLSKLFNGFFFIEQILENRYLKKYQQKCTLFTKIH